MTDNAQQRRPHSNFLLAMFMEMCIEESSLPFRPEKTPDLSGHLKAEAEFVARLVQLGAVNVGREGHGDPLAQLLLVAQPDLWGNSWIKR